uniref:Uncharacterized protein n=1 Tax=Molossus molossus TaxID=27622 RepID=A0A7J8DTY1_MOLMO|nr:hypothetical protein HJG59_009185 [Molossus molossus]
MGSFHGTQPSSLGVSHASLLELSQKIILCAVRGSHPCVQNRAMRLRESMGPTTINWEIPCAPVPLSMPPMSPHCSSRTPAFKLEWKGCLLTRGLQCPRIHSLCSSWKEKAEEHVRSLNSLLDLGSSYFHSSWKVCQDLELREVSSFSPKRRRLGSHFSPHFQHPMETVTRVSFATHGEGYSTCPPTPLPLQEAMTVMMMLAMTVTMTVVTRRRSTSHGPGVTPGTCHTRFLKLFFFLIITQGYFFHLSSDRVWGRKRETLM